MDPQTIVTVGFFVFVLWLPTLTLAAVFLFRRLRPRVQLEAIQYGHDISFDHEVRAAETRPAGIVLVAAGVAIVLADAIVTAVTADLRVLGFLAPATVPLAVGLGLLVEHRLQLRDIRQRKTASPEREGRE